MNNMITKACEDAGIVSVPSRRTYALNHWLDHRMVEFYPGQPGYDEKAAQSASVQYPELNAVALPDAVRGDRGDKWAFVSLTAADFTDMAEWDIAFGEAFPLSLANLDSETKIPWTYYFFCPSLTISWLVIRIGVRISRI